MNKFQSMISDEIEKTSNAGSIDNTADIDLFTSATDSNNNETVTIVEDSHITTETLLVEPRDTNSTNRLISHVPLFFCHEGHEEICLQKELQDMYSGDHSRKKYMWLSNAGMPYTFGGHSHIPHIIKPDSGICNIMDKINLQFGLEFDSCLITRYLSGDQALSLHQDNESILDKSHPIILTSIGSPRTLQFWDSDREIDGNLVHEVTVKQGDLLFMESGCQDNLWHKVLPASSEAQEGIRYAISFRRTVP